MDRRAADSRFFCDTLMHYLEYPENFKTFSIDVDAFSTWSHLRYVLLQRQPLHAFFRNGAFSLEEGRISGTAT
jgi:hypothetical protein